MLRSCIVVSFSLVLLSASAAHATTVNLGDSKDTMIFSNGTNNAAGGQTTINFGTNNQGNNRHALLQFDLSSLPSGATIQSASLTLYLNGWTSLNFGADRQAAIHRLTAPWGNGNTVGTMGGGGQGGPATTNQDVTWTAAFFNQTNWATPGGDFVGTATNTITVSNPTDAVNIPFTWNVTSDVQAFYSGAQTNNGWLLRNAGTGNGTLMNFVSREGASQFVPVLSITYVPEPATWALAAIGAGVMGGAYRWRRRMQKVT